MCEREARALADRLGAPSIYLCRSAGLCLVQVQFGAAYLLTEAHVRPQDAWREMRDALTAIQRQVHRAP